MTPTNDITKDIEDLRTQLEEFAIHIKPGTTKGKHRTAIFDTLELAKLVEALINEARVDELKNMPQGLTYQGLLNYLNERRQTLQTQLDRLPVVNTTSTDKGVGEVLGVSDTPNK